jgi:hypothetical protein
MYKKNTPTANDTLLLALDEELIAIHQYLVDNAELLHSPELPHTLPDSYIEWCNSTELPATHITHRLYTFHTSLMEVLGIPWCEDIYDKTIPGVITTKKPILQGDEGIRIRIIYYYDRDDTPGYFVSMGSMGSDNSIRFSASTVQELMTLISRGYTAHRILENGTRYYHKR